MQFTCSKLSLFKNAIISGWWSFDARKKKSFWIQDIENTEDLEWITHKEIGIFILKNMLGHHVFHFSEKYCEEEHFASAQIILFIRHNQFELTECNSWTGGHCWERAICHCRQENLKLKSRIKTMRYWMRTNHWKLRRHRANIVAAQIVLYGCIEPCRIPSRNSLSIYRQSLQSIHSSRDGRNFII